MHLLCLIQYSYVECRGSLQVIIAVAANVNAITVDWIARNIYWSDVLTGIYVGSIDGKSQSLLIRGNRTVRYLSVAVDPRSGFVNISVILVL